MKSLKLINLLFLFSFLSACSYPKSTIDFDPKINFSALKTYQLDYLPSAEFAEVNPLIHKRIIDAINANLKARIEAKMGAKKLAPTDLPDFIISYSINYRKELFGSALSTQVEIAIRSSQLGHINLSSGEQLIQTLNGTLNINIFSPIDHTLLWRATSAKLISDEENSPLEANQRIKRIVSEMLSHFPAMGI